MKEQWQKIVELQKRLEDCEANVREMCDLDSLRNEHAPDMARRLLRASELEPQIRLIVETVNAGLARELREVLGGDK